MTFPNSCEWSRADDSAFFLCCGRSVSSSSSRLVDDDCRPVSRCGARKLLDQQRSATESNSASQNGATR